MERQCDNVLRGHGYRRRAGDMGMQQCKKDYKRKTEENSASINNGKLLCIINH
jgi:hypothetical protein